MYGRAPRAANAPQNSGTEPAELAGRGGVAACLCTTGARRTRRAASVARQGTAVKQSAQRARQVASRSAASRASAVSRPPYALTQALFTHRGCGSAATPVCRASASCCGGGEASASPASDASSAEAGAAPRDTAMTWRHPASGDAAGAAGGASALASCPCGARQRGDLFATGDTPARVGEASPAPRSAVPSAASAGAPTSSGPNPPTQGASAAVPGESQRLRLVSSAAGSDNADAPGVCSDSD